MSILSEDSYLSLQKDISRLSITEALKRLYEVFPDRMTFSTSFSYEDQVITDHISKAIPVSIFTLDTGRLFPETYSTWSRTVERYGLPIKAFYPGEEELQGFVTSHGPNAFYESIELRQRCCHIRKV